MWGSTLWYLGEGMLGPLFAVFAQRIGGDLLEITWGWATYLFVMGVLTIIFGHYSDKLDQKKVMLFGYGLNALFTFAYVFISTPTHLFMVQAGLGFATALSTPTWSALYAKYAAKNKHGAAWGLANGLPDVITAIAVIIGGLIVQYFSFTLLFLIMGSIQIIATIYQAEILYGDNK